MYLQFLQKSLIGIAGVGHSLLKTFERDGASSYEEVDDIRAMTQGPNVRDRMTTRICSWAAVKWKGSTQSLSARAPRSMATDY